MISRRAALTGALAGSLCLAHKAAANPPRRIGVLTPGDSQWEADAFLSELASLGYPGETAVIVDVRSADGEVQRLTTLAAEMAQRPYDLLIGVNTPGALAIAGTGTTKPIIAGVISDPISAGFTTSLARPDRNITGITNLSLDLTVKRLDLLREVLPRLTRLGALYHPDDMASQPQIVQLQEAAASRGMTVLPFAVRNREDLDSALADAQKAGAEALIRLAGQAQTIGPATGKASAMRKIPAMLLDRPSVAAGGLMAYFADFGAMWRRVAAQAAQSLDGKPISDIPFEQPTRFTLLLNAKTANELGVTFPYTLLAAADEVIE